jgi:hypothetical protein
VLADGDASSVNPRSSAKEAMEAIRDSNGSGTAAAAAVALDEEVCIV